MQVFWKSYRFWISLAGLAVVLILGLTNEIDLTGNQIVTLISVLVGSHTASDVATRIANVFDMKMNEKIEALVNERMEQKN